MRSNKSPSYGCRYLIVGVTKQVAIMGDSARTVEGHESLEVVCGVIAIDACSLYQAAFSENPEKAREKYTIS